MPNSANKSPSLSVSVVLYKTPIDDVLAFVKSLLLSYEALGSSHSKPILTLEFIFNSEEIKTDLEFQIRKIDIPTTIDFSWRSISGQGNIGYGPGHNLSINAAGSDYHLISNADVILSTSSLAVGIDTMEKNARISAVGPSGTDTKGSLQHLTKKYPSVFVLFLRSFAPSWLKEKYEHHIHEYEVRSLSSKEPTIGVEILSGCFMLCRTERLKSCSGFDENFFLYFEDFDLSLRLSENGSLCFNPKMKIVHHGGGASSKGLKHIWIFTKSMFRFFNKHGWKLI